jgi:hypothetical protein
MQVLGKLPNLAILRLRYHPFLPFDIKRGERIRLTFHREAFPSLMVLELLSVGGLGLVEFKDGATPKLEQLHLDPNAGTYSSGFLSGLASLQSLKELTMELRDYLFKEKFLEDVQDQLARNRNGPVFKLV